MAMVGRGIGETRVGRVSRAVDRCLALEHRVFGFVHTGVRDAKNDAQTLSLRHLKSCLSLPLEPGLSC